MSICSECPCVSAYHSCRLTVFFAELEDGSLVYMKEYKNDDLHIGDRIIYTTWVLYPNEVVTVTKDDGETDNPPLV